MERGSRVPSQQLPNPPLDAPLLEFPSSKTFPFFDDPNDWRPFRVAGQPTIVTMFSVECSSYFDWQSLGMMYGFRRSGQPGKIVRLLACEERDLATYKGMDIAPTMVVPNWRLNPRTGDAYSAINKPVGVQYWLDHSPDANEVEWVVILDADQILRRPLLPWELGAERGRPVAAPYGYLIGCDNILSELHTSVHPDICDKVGGVLVMHIDDIKKLAPLWISKTEEVRADTAHYATDITGDIYGQGWISEMYGYSFGASEVGLRHIVNYEMMLYPGYAPPAQVDPRVFHYGLPMSVSFDGREWTWGKSSWRSHDVALVCGEHFPEPLPAAVVDAETPIDSRRKDLISIENVAVLNRALREYHRKKGCSAEFERDVGVMDLNGAAFDATGAILVDAWRNRTGAGGVGIEGSVLRDGVKFDKSLWIMRKGLEKGLMMQVIMGSTKEKIANLDEFVVELGSKRSAGEEDGQGQNKMHEGMELNSTALGGESFATFEEVLSRKGSKTSSDLEAVTKGRFTERTPELFRGLDAIGGRRGLAEGRQQIVRVSLSAASSALLGVEHRLENLLGGFALPWAILVFFVALFFVGRVCRRRKTKVETGAMKKRRKTKVRQAIDA